MSNLNLFMNATGKMQFVRGKEYGQEQEYLHD